MGSIHVTGVNTVLTVSGSVQNLLADIRPGITFMLCHRP